MTFKTTAVLSALLTFGLGVGYLFAGSVLVGRWQIDPTDSVLLFGRRIGASFLGLSVMFFLARAIPNSPARRALSSGAVVTCLLLAALGTAEFSAGHAAAPILASAALELLVALAFARHLVADRKLALLAAHNEADGVFVARPRGWLISMEK